MKRRSVRLPGSRGFQLVNDGPQMGMMLARLVAYYAEDLGLLDGCDVGEPPAPESVGLLDFAA